VLCFEPSADAIANEPAALPLPMTRSGKKAQARKDLERILAEDSSYEGVREMLSELTA
jgi:hypothetical protein